jgi:hypothetical protein
MQPSVHQGNDAFRRRQAAEALAAQALGFLAEDPKRLQDFLAATGIDPGRIRVIAREPHFLASVLDHVLADEARLLVPLAAAVGIAPAEIAAARAALGGT